MPRVTLYDHPKFARLVFILGVPEPHALGYLEYLWRVGYASGNPVVGDELAVELSSKWPGERGILCKALIESGLIDKLEDGKFGIHDLHENAPDYVLSRFRMERYRKSRAAEKTQKGNGELRTVTQQLRNGYAPPAHAHAHKEKKSTSSCPEPEVQASGQNVDAKYPIFPCIGAIKSWEYTKEFYATLHEAYPGVDLKAEARKAHAWCVANKSKRKTAKGMPRFLNGWMERAQNRGGNGEHGNSEPEMSEAEHLAKLHRDFPDDVPETLEPHA